MGLGLNHSPPRGGPGNNTSVLAKNDDQKEGSVMNAMYEAIAENIKTELVFGFTKDASGIIKGAIATGLAIGQCDQNFDFLAFCEACGIAPRLKRTHDGFHVWIGERA